MAMQCAPHCTVSVIMPTAGRPEFVEHQLTRIAAQEAVEGGGSTGRPVSEVIVVDDSPPALRVKSLVPNSVTVIRGLRVNYVVLQQRASVGAKRNMAANAATGDVIAHWDDDDFYGSRRLGEQLRHIVQGAAVTVLPHQYTYLLPPDELYAAGSSVAKTQALSWGPHFGTLAYRRSLWKELGGFADNSLGEDYHFAQRAKRRGARLTVLKPSSGKSSREPLFVYVRTGVNTWNWTATGGGAKKNHLDPLHSHRVADPRAMLSRADAEFAARLRGGSLLGELAARRTATGGPPNLREPDDLDPDFFYHLFRDADARIATAGGGTCCADATCQRVVACAR